jgi:hypothetical protein
MQYSVLLAAFACCLFTSGVFGLLGQYEVAWRCFVGGAAAITVSAIVLASWDISRRSAPKPTPDASAPVNLAGRRKSLSLPASPTQTSLAGDEAASVSAPEYGYGGW